MTIGKIPIWLDCDPGHDDAIALLLACFNPAFDLLGVSACHGNAPQSNTSYNTRSLITAFGEQKSIPVYAGAIKPWVREPKYAPDIHGASGLDGTTLLPVPECELHTGSYLDAMEEAIMEHQGEISLVSTGSLTSVATVFKERPHLIKMIKYISIMGGGIGIGNTNKNMSAEFNICIDPQAASFIFGHKVLKDKCILLPLNITHKAIATADILHKIQGNDGNKLRQLFFELFQFFAHSYKDAQGFDLGPPVHDPLALIPLLEFYKWEPSSRVQFSYKRFDLQVVEDLDSADVGKLCVLREYSPEDSQGSIVGFDLNFDFFWDQVYEALYLAEKSSTIEV